MSIERLTRRYICEVRPLKWKPKKMTKGKYWQEISLGDPRYESAPYEQSCLISSNGFISPGDIVSR